MLKIEISEKSLLLNCNPHEAPITDNSNNSGAPNICSFNSHKESLNLSGPQIFITVNNSSCREAKSRKEKSKQ